MKELLFGTAGIPLSSKGLSTAQGIEEVKNLGLGAMELEFVRSIHITKDKAPEVKEAAKKNNIILTCHAPYYINLNSQEKLKQLQSKERILNSSRISNLCGGYSVCFHPGFYMKQDQEKVFEVILKNIRDITKKLKQEGINIWIRPETTGKESQFGSLKEIIDISKEFEKVLPCIDFSHLHARSNGKVNSYDEFSEILSLVEKELGREALDNMHNHVSGINYGDKGERNHMNLEESDFRYKDLLKSLKEFKCKGVLICESPNIEEDAKLMKKYYDSI